jgi:hypothetical protein
MTHRIICGATERTILIGTYADMVRYLRRRGNWGRFERGVIDVVYLSTGRASSISID